MTRQGKEPESGPFISYSRDDQPFVRKLHDALAAHGRKAWVDWAGILPTEEWMQKIRGAIDGAEAVVFVLSPDSVQSKVCREEVEHAALQNKRLIPIVSREVDADDVPGALAKLNWIYIRDSDPFESRVAELLAALDMDLDWIRDHARLLVRAREWRERGDDSSRLLRGRDLDDAEGWLREVDPRQKREATPLQTQFIVASRQAETRRRNWQRAIGLIALVVLSVLTVFAWLQKNEAQRQTSVALSRQLAARALNIPDTDPLQRLLVSTLATRYSHTAEADARLAAALLPTVPLRTTLWSPHRDHAMGCISFHRGGDWVAGSNSHGVTVWNVATGRVHAYRHNGDGFDGVHFGPDEGRVAIADEGRAIVWDWRNDKEQLFGGKPNQTASLAALSEDGKSVYVASGGKLTQWDLESRREHVLVDAGATGDYEYAFSADARRFAQADPEHTIRVWELPSLQIVATLDAPQTPGLKLAFSADGKTLAAGGVADTLPVWDLEPEGPRLVNRLDESKLRSLAFSPDGGTLAIGGVEPGIRQWDFRKRSQRWPLATPHETWAVAFHPSGRLLASSGEAGALRLWEPARQHDHILRKHQDVKPIGEAFSSDGRMLVWRRGKGYFLWDPSGRKSETEVQAFPSEVEALELSQRGPLMAALQKDRAIGLWNSDTGERLPPLAAEGFSPRRVEVSGTGSAVGAVDLDGKLVVWHLPARTSWSQEAEKTGQAMSLAFSADGKRLASGGLEGVIKLWDVVTGRAESLRGPSETNVTALAFSGDGQRLAAADRSVIVIWDLERRTVQRNLRGHTGSVISLAFSPDSRILASGALDKSALLWDPGSGEIILKLEEQNDPMDVVGVAFSTDGKLLATRGASGVVRLWNVDSAQWTEMACSILNRNLTRKEWETYLPSQMSGVRSEGRPACPRVPPGVEGRPDDR